MSRLDINKMATVSNRTSINKKTLSGIQDLNVDVIDTGSVSIGNITIQNNTISGVNTISSQNNSDIVIQGRGTGDVLLRTNNIDRVVVGDNGQVQSSGLIVGLGGVNTTTMNADHGFFTNNLNVDNTLYADVASGFVGIGTLIPNDKLHVAGSINIDDTHTYKINSVDVLSQTSLGTGITQSNLQSVGVLNELSVSGQATMGNIFSTGVGTFSGVYATTFSASVGSFSNIAMNPVKIGIQAGQTNQNSGAISIGNLSGQNNQASNSIAVGIQAGGTGQLYRGIAIGEQAGQNNQGTQSIAIGLQAGQGTQRSDCIAIGVLAGTIDQQSGSIAIGRSAGQNSQGWNSIAIGRECGRSFQGKEAVAIGSGCGNQSQGFNAVAIGVNAGRFSQGARGVAVGEATAERNQGGGAFAFGFASGQSYQGADAIAMGFQAGQGTQGQNAIALGRQAGFARQGSGAISFGFEAGRNTQSSQAIAIGIQAGQNSQASSSIAIGFQAGQSFQNVNSIAIGRQAGALTQGASCIAIGTEAGEFNQGNNAVAIGDGAGFTGQGNSAVAIGIDSGFSNQGSNSVAIGLQAGEINQGINCIAIGLQAGDTNQGANSIAIGRLSGASTQGSSCVAIGTEAGEFNQGNNAVAIGDSAGYTGQGNSSIAIGIDAGFENQGASSIAIGANAGLLNQHPNSIILNATGTALNSTTQSACFINPIRQQDGLSAGILSYNTTSKEITYSQTLDFSGSLNLTSSGTYKINDVDVLTSTTLGSGVVNSSLTSVGTLSSLTISGDLTVDTNTLFVDSTNNRVGVGISPTQTLDVNGVSNFRSIPYFNNNELRFRAPPDLNHFIGYKNTFGGLSGIDGPVLAGFAGGVLGTMNGGQNWTARWDINKFYSNKPVDVSGNLDVVGNAAISGNLTVDTNSLFVNATNNRVGVGTTSPSVALDVVGNISSSAHISASGRIVPTTFQAGQIIQTLVFDKFNTDPSTYTFNSTTATTWVSVQYTPKTFNSKIKVEVDAYYIVNGNLTDGFIVSVVENNVEQFYKKQYWDGQGGGGTRSTVLLPLMCTYPSGGPSTRTLQIRFKRDGSDDTLTLTEGVDRNWSIVITEICTITY